jgi:hypothetical protein
LRIVGYSTLLLVGVQQANGALRVKMHDKHAALVSIGKHLGMFTDQVQPFGNAFREACRAAGVAKSAHGVRKIGATRAAENGATVAELEAIFGWQGGGMASLYTRAADRARLAKGAIAKLARTEDAHSIPAPMEKVRDSAPKGA